MGRELARFDAYRHGRGMPDLAPHDWYETGSIVYEVLYQGHVDQLQQAARDLAAI